MPLWIKLVVFAPFIALALSLAVAGFTQRRRDRRAS